MASIFVSYSRKDGSIVVGYIKKLEERGHTVLYDANVLKSGSNMQLGLRNAQSSADGSLFFLTENSISSDSVLDEIRVARSYYDDVRNPRFLVPVVFGDVRVPDMIRDLFYLQTSGITEDQVVEKIDDAINSFGPQKTKPKKKAPTKKANPYTPVSTKSKASTPVLKMGSKGPNVTFLQRDLADWGFFKSAADGEYGPTTVNAVKAFQRANNLAETGEWDEDTKDIALNGSFSPFGSTATEELQDVPQEQSSDDPNYWLLKIYADDWGMENIDKNDEGFFNSHFNSRVKRPDYENFRAVKKGDIGLAYDYSSQKAILFNFEVTQPLHDDPVRNEIFNFKVLNILNEVVPISSFQEFLSFHPDVEEQKEVLFKLREDEYKRIISLIQEDDEDIHEPPGNNNRKVFFSDYGSDSASKDIKDQLGFESDIEALARVIAYKEVKPPLAIGLFGNWGSGKSFFMNKLQSRIEELTTDKSGVFCKEVVQINFNSWHYSDSNLWASLITKIFDDLKRYGQSDKTKLENLFKNLNSTQELLIETQQKKTNVENEITSLTKRQTKLETEIKEKTSDLKTLNPDEITKAVLDDPEIKKKLVALKEKLKFLDIKEYGEIQQKINELTGGGKKVWEIIKMLYSFRKGKAWMALAIAVFVAAVVYYIIEHVGDLRSVFGKYKEIISGIALLLSKALISLRPALKTIDSAYEDLKSLKTTWFELDEKARNKFNAEQQDINNQLEAAKASRNDLREQIVQLETKQNQLQQEIDDITSGRKIARFIEGRVTDERYINSLGIISWVRKDFEELDFLLKQQYDAKILAETGRQKIEDIFEVDRIILYVDDLDRCDVSIVVKVLEAINLLLAFPLFVVVVGVDPRWMHNALTIKYSKLLRNDKTKGNTENGQQNIGRPATSYDYLEKIFQIPFVLKPIDKKGKDKLIMSQLEKKEPATAAKKKEEEQPKVDPQPDGTKPVAKQNDEQPAVMPEQTEEEIAKAAAKEKAEQEEAARIAAEKVVKPESLQVSDEEISFMKAIGFLIGNSPRTIKRYINMYRIIRTHSIFDYAKGRELEYYYAAMVLLGVITSMPEAAPHFFENIKSYEAEKTFTNFLDSYFSTSNTKSFDFRRLADAIKNNETVKPIGDLPVEKFQRNIDLISRFSFRNLL